MIALNNGQYIIGFDNGYQFGKTVQTLFDNGVYALGKVEPSVKEHSLKYERRFYKVGEGRAVITEDKVSDENARLLTMIAVAKELSFKGITKADIILAVGLPFSDYGREKKRMLTYYEQKPILKFEFEGVRYDVNISRVFVFPQCYSAVAPRLGNMKGDYLVVDIGSKTTDVVYLKNGIPVERKSITIEKAMVKWLRQIQGSLQVQYGKNIPESEILKVLLKQEYFLPRTYANLIRENIRTQIRTLELELKEREYALDYMNVIYVGGGAAAVKNFSEHRPNVAHDCDIHANAKGYEYLAYQILKNREWCDMLDERVITLRFKEENFLDMELYQSLEKEKKEMGLSMPVYVKEILRQHFENIQQERMNGDLNRCLERMQNMVHEEFVSLNDTITGMIARIPEISSSNIRRTAYEGISLEKEEILPEYSEELPEGMEGVLEQFI